VIHFYDTRTDRALCGERLKPGYPSNSRMDTSLVTCRKCLAKLPKADSDQACFPDAQDHHSHGGAVNRLFHLLEEPLQRSLKRAATGPNLYQTFAKWSVLALIGSKPAMHGFAFCNSLSSRLFPAPQR
jgi:hypothetical protein